MILDAFRLDGKTAIVTGAGRGIGAEIARSFAEVGAAVVCVARNSCRTASSSRGGRVYASIAPFSPAPNICSRYSRGRCTSGRGPLGFSPARLCRNGERRSAIWYSWLT